MVRNLVLKNANLLHKQGFKDSQFSTTVPITTKILFGIAKKWLKKMVNNMKYKVFGFMDTPLP